MNLAAAILAGGESSRFGADKALADLAGAPMIARVARVLRSSAQSLAVVGHARAAARLNAVALFDGADAVRGPLAGVLAGLDWAAAAGADWLATAPCDAPLLPDDMVERLLAGAVAAGASAAFAAAPGGLHPLCAVWRPALGARLRAFFAQGVHPPVREFAPDAVRVAFADEMAFFNVNTPEDMARVLAHLSEA